MTEKKKSRIEEDVNAELGGMGLYGTTGNIEIEGYRMSGDIENAGRLDKGFQRTKEHDGARASIIDDRELAGKIEDVDYDPDQADEEDLEAQARANEADERAEKRT